MKKVCCHNEEKAPIDCLSEKIFDKDKINSTNLYNKILSADISLSKVDSNLLPPSQDLCLPRSSAAATADVKKKEGVLGDFLTSVGKIGGCAANSAILEACTGLQSLSFEEISTALTSKEALKACFLKAAKNAVIGAGAGMVGGVVQGYGPSDNSRGKEKYKNLIFSKHTLTGRAKQADRIAEIGLKEIKISPDQKDQIKLKPKETKLLNLIIENDQMISKEFDGEVSLSVMEGLIKDLVLKSVDSRLEDKFLDGIDNDDYNLESISEEDTAKIEDNFKILREELQKKRRQKQKEKEKEKEKNEEENQSTGAAAAAAEDAKKDNKN